MLAGTGAVAPDKAAVRRVVRALLPPRIDLRSTLGRRAKAILTSIVESLGPDATAAQHQDAKRLCELMLMAEAARATSLATGRKVDLDRLIRLEGTITRMRRQLGLDKPRAPKRQTIHDYLARRAAGATPAA
jgi:hypothetical protein